MFMDFFLAYVMLLYDIIPGELKNKGACKWLRLV